MSLGQTSMSNALAADAGSLNKLKLQAGQSSPAAIKETAKQFESLFMRELIKSMREATMKSGMLDSPGGDLGADLLDQQFAVQMSGRPGGLSDLIAAQLSRQMGIAPSDAAAGENALSGAAGMSGVQGAFGPAGAAGTADVPDLSAAEPSVAVRLSADARNDPVSCEPERGRGTHLAALADPS